MDEGEYFFCLFSGCHAKGRSASGGKSAVTKRNHGLCPWRFHLAGLGFSTKTPFNTPGEVSEEEFKKALNKLTGLQNLCLFCHHLPKNTLLDVLPNGIHVGSQAIKSFIDKEKPVYFAPANTPGLRARG